MGELKKVFRPEFINRVDDIIVFHKLMHDDIQKIAGKMLEDLKKQLSDMEISLEFTPAAVEAVANAGFDPVLRRASAAPRDPQQDRGPGFRENAGGRDPGRQVVRVRLQGRPVHV